MTYLIDSDQVTDYLQGKQRTIELLNSLAQDAIAISVITLGEVYEGIYYGNNPERNELIFQRFLQVADVINVDSAVARRFAMIRGYLRQTGLLVAQPDILIAATAIEFDLMLVTRNLRHFTRMPGLRLYEQSAL